MKLGDMTFKQIAEICANHKCNNCPFYEEGFRLSLRCLLLKHVPSHQDLNMEVKTDADTV